MNSQPDTSQSQETPLAPGLLTRRATTGDARKQSTPLAERMRPKQLNDIVGQGDLVATGSMLRSLLENDKV